MQAASVSAPQESVQVTPGADLNQGWRYIRSIIAWPKPEQDTFFAPSIWRAKS